MVRIYRVSPRSTNIGKRCAMPRTYIARPRVRIVASGPAGARLLSTQDRSGPAINREPRFDPALSLPGLPSHLLAPARMHRAPALV